MFTNQELLNKKNFQKALIMLPTITLSPEEATRFIDYIYDQSVLKNNARQIKMTKASQNIRAVGLGTEKILHPGATFSSSNYRTRLIHNLITLTAKEVRGCVVIPDDDIQDNIEGDAFVDHIMQMVTKQIANELDEAYWIGDTHSLGGFADTDIRSLFDGWRYRILHSGGTYYNDVSGAATILDAANVAADMIKTISLGSGGTGYTKGDILTIVQSGGSLGTATVSAVTTDGVITAVTLLARGSGYAVADSLATTGGTGNGATINILAIGGDFSKAGKIAEQDTEVPYNWEFKWGKARRVLPAIYKKEGLANLRYFTNDQVEQDFIDALSTRNTNIGDAALTGGSLSPGKIPIVSCPLLTSDLDADGKIGSGAYTDCLLTHKDNLVVGIYKEIEMETERQPADRATYFYYTLRGDLAIENVNAIVIIKNLITG